MEIDDTQRETTRTRGCRVIKRPTQLDDYGVYIYFAYLNCIVCLILCDIF